MKNPIASLIFNDSVKMHNPINSSYFFDSQYYIDLENKKQELIENWKSSGDIKNEFKDIKKYFHAHLTEFESEKIVMAKNSYLFENEVKARVNEHNPFVLLGIEPFDFLPSAFELLENIENKNYIQELYKTRKYTTGSTKNSGITADEANRIKNCMTQGRELYWAGKNGNLMVKPLNFFYSLTAYAYALIILNNPNQYGLDQMPGSHGLNYLPDYAKIQFGGSIKQGTFSNLFNSFPTSYIHNLSVDIIQDNMNSLRVFHQRIIETDIGVLLSMIPEIRDYYDLSTEKRSRTHPLEIDTEHDARTGTKWKFQIGDGQQQPPKQDIENAFPGFQIENKYGKTIVSVPFQDAHKIQATIYTDAKGDLWFIENPFFPIIIPEICINFLLTNAFSNIMRYSPDEWGEILSNQVNADASLIIRKYLSAFENKFPILLLRSLSKFHPYIISA